MKWVTADFPGTGTGRILDRSILACPQTKDNFVADIYRIPKISNKLFDVNALNVGAVNFSRV